MRNQVTRTASTRRSRFSIPSMDANSNVSSMFGSDGESVCPLSAVKFIPMAAMSEVSVAIRLDSVGSMRRLNAIAEPPCKIGKRLPDVDRPVWMSILLFRPWKNHGEFARFRFQSETVTQINAAIAKGKQFGAQKIASSETAKPNRTSVKSFLQSFFPLRLKMI